MWHLEIDGSVVRLVSGHENTRCLLHEQRFELNAAQIDAITLWRWVLQMHNVQLVVALEGTRR